MSCTPGALDWPIKNTKSVIKDINEKETERKIIFLNVIYEFIAYITK